MQNSLKKNRIVIAMFVVLLVASVFVLCFGADNIAYAQNTWGGVETSTLWQYKDNALDVDGAKAIVDGWDKSKLGEPIVIAVIDTGINTRHELFDDTLLKNEKGEILGYNVTATAQGIVDIGDAPSNHGTTTAGVLAMLIKEFGLQDYIKIYPIKANTDKADEFKLKNLAKAINWAVDGMGADIVNLSLGLLDDAYKKVAVADRTEFEFAIENAKEKSVIVAAAGNNGADSATTQGIFYPAAWDSTLSVMGYGKNGNVYSTSNYGAQYDICAPSEDIYTASGLSYTNKTGTSMATPAVSFASALLKLRYRTQGSEINSPDVVKMIRNLAGKTAQKGVASFRALNLCNLLTQDFENTVYEYSNPTSISVIHNGSMGSGDMADVIVKRANDKSAISFVAKLSPLGKVDPEIENSIQWVVSRVEEFGEDVVEEVVADTRGTRFDFVVSRGGKFIVSAKLPLFNLEVSQEVSIEYVPYYVGEVRVTLLDSILLGVDNAPRSAVLYTTEKTTFALTGVEFVNPDVETKWFVNGKYVASGKTFDFVPKKAGRYEITAQYGDNAKVDFDFKFVAQVKSFILRPLDLSMLVVGCVVAIGVVVAIIIVQAKNKSKKIDKRNNNIAN